MSMTEYEQLLHNVVEARTQVRLNRARPERHVRAMDKLVECLRTLHAHERVHHLTEQTVQLKG
jgi:hypothetical protein